MGLFFGAIFVLLCGGIFPLIVKNNWKVKACILFTAVSAVLMTVFVCPVLLGSGPAIITLHLNFPFGDTRFVIDTLSAFFILLISWFPLLGIIYGEGYLRHYVAEGKNISAHLLFFAVFISSMLLVVSSFNIILFLIAWEMMSVSSFFLLLFDDDKREIMNAGLSYLVAMHIGVLILISGFLLLYSKSGSLDFETFKSVISANAGMGRFIFFIFFVGFGIKAGFVPLHSWLPIAHPAAPSHVSGLMSGIMIKTGIYGILRVLTFIGTPTLSMAYTVLLISLFSALWGIFYSVSQRDIKKVLAYSSSENIGIIGIGIGIGMFGMIFKNNLLVLSGFSGAVIHILNHAVFKNLLFYCSGTVYQVTHTRDMEKMGGLLKVLPYTGIAMLFGCIAICGLPPLNGFIGEFLIYFASLSGLVTKNELLILTLIASMAVLSLVGAVALLNFTKLFSIVFLGEPRETKQEGHKEISVTAVLPVMILAAATLVLGLFPQYLFSFSRQVVSSFVSIDMKLFQDIYSILVIISKLGLILLGTAVLLYIARVLLVRNKKICKQNTWDCGYGNYNSRMQYTGFSFSAFFINLVKPFVRPVYGFNTSSNFLENIFPRLSSFRENVEDLFNTYIIKPFGQFVLNFMKFFSVIQTGYTQQYILYGLIFMIIMFFLLITGVV
jgi:hydrogenase-4 component B